MVKRATLHNAGFMDNLDLHIGDMVFVEKGGEIIPKITSVDLTARSFMMGEKVRFISRCPECGTPLMRVEGEAAIFCPNDTSCPPQLKGRIEHFISRKAMNIDGLGAETVDLLYSVGLIHDASDLYKLRIPDIYRLERMGYKSAENIVRSIERSLDVPFERVLFAIGIRFVGETVAKKLARAFGSMDRLANATYDELIAVDEIGEKIAQSILRFFANEQCLAFVGHLRESGVQMEIVVDESIKRTDKLAGKNIVISGVFVQHSRNEYKAMIEQHGGINVSSISSKTSFILAGRDMGPAKLEKAQKLGIAIMGEEEFLAMVE
jgi:DNA ligase (NAD+)